MMCESQVSRTNCYELALASCDARMQRSSLTIRFHQFALLKLVKNFVCNITTFIFFLRQDLFQYFVQLVFDKKKKKEGIVLRVNIIFLLLTPIMFIILSQHAYKSKWSGKLFTFSLQSIKISSSFSSCFSTLPSIFCCHIERICLIAFGLQKKASIESFI